MKKILFIVTLSLVALFNTGCNNNIGPVYTVTKEQYDKAIKMENIDYVQREHYYYIYSLPTAVILNSLVDYVSPNVYFYSASNVTVVGGSSGSATFEEYYIEKNNNTYYKYTLDDNDGKYAKTTESDGSNFKSSNDLSPIGLLNFAGITYDTIKDHFDKDLCSYSFKYTTTSSGKQYVYDVVFSFLDTRIYYISYELKIDNLRSESGYLYYNYLTKSPTLPTDIK